MAFYGMSDREVLDMPFVRYIVLTEYKHERMKAEIDAIEQVKKKTPGRRGK